MYRKILLLLFLTLGLSVSTARATVPIEVENYSFEIPDDGQKHDIDVDVPGVVTGWARTDPTTSAGREFGWTPTDGQATAFMGKNAMIYNLTDFLLMEGDTFQLVYDSRSTWQGNHMVGQLYYEVEGKRIVFDSTAADLSEQPTMGTFVLDANAVGPAANDYKLGIQFTHEYVEGLSPDDNIWAGLDFIELKLTSPLIRAQNPFPEHESAYASESVPLTWTPGPNAPDVDSYRVYLSENRDDVSAGSPNADKGSTSNWFSCEITSSLPQILAISLSLSFHL